MEPKEETVAAGRDSVLAGLAQLLAGLAPGALRRLGRELADRLAKAPLRLNEYGYDPYGFHPETARTLMLPGALAHRHWFRVENHGIERIPSGRVILIANHSGQVGYDGVMLGMSMLLDAAPPRLCRGMAEYLFFRTPWASIGASRSGTLAGTPENCVAMLEEGECVMVFPEGARGANKPWPRRYQLERFGQGFMRLALETDTPIVPVGIVGAEEQQPGLANLSDVAERLGLPSLPITLTFPWLGPLGIAFALPVKYHIHFGEPLRFEGEANEEDVVIQKKVDVVRDSIRDLLARGLEQRPGIFF
jgi:1-acyl-sn-glycerol-3-phosphate acyltransferase